MRLASITVAAVALSACTARECGEGASEAAVTRAMPGVEITGGEGDTQGGCEVTGTLDGQEYEFDLVGPEGGWRVVEIQRDIAWGDAPAPVRDLVATAPNGFLPERVIESRQPADGSVVYELFAPGAEPGHPTMEVRFMHGETEILPPTH